ncbi:MAG: M15 family metallopeptidase [Prevotella sp.]|nr:M15 family metallopeptidase [Prevotella sp.]
MTAKRLLTGFILTILLLSANRISAQQHFTIDTISDEVFARMKGKSFPNGCTIARQDLRYLRVLHRNAEDSICHGELVCNKRIAQDLIDIFKKLYEAHYPIERIKLIDDYDADDERSMSDNNTSSFCFRTVPGTKKLSNHARGMAIDINTLYNPYVRHNRKGQLLISPANGKRYANRNFASPYKIEAGDLCHRLFLEHGFTWGGSWKTMKDYQHFEKR